MEDRTIFRKSPEGRLMSGEPDEKSGRKYTLWFNYTRDLMNDLEEGDLVAAPNFNRDGDGQEHWSILKINSVNPTHYAFGGDGEPDGYPGFVMEAAKNMSVDWTEQQSESYEDVTKIVCEAVPSDKEFVYKPGAESIEEHPISAESAMAMVGKEVELLSSKMTSRVFNGDLQASNSSIFSPGSLLRDDEVDILINIEDMIKTHSGIFGFTGVGKSNLISTLIDKILDNDEHTNVVVFDLMDEYTALTIDLLLDTHYDAQIINVGMKTLPRPVLNLLSLERDGDISEATRSLVDGLLLPKSFRSDRSEFAVPIRRLLENEQLKVVSGESAPDVESLVTDAIEKDHRWNAPKTAAVEDLEDEIIEEYGDKELTEEVADEIIERLGFGSAYGGFTNDKKPFSAKSDIMEEGAEDHIESTLVRRLRKFSESEEISIDSKHTTGPWQIANKLQEQESEGKEKLFIITSHDFAEMYDFASRLGDATYQLRREAGENRPLTQFIFDEADQFIPSDPDSGPQAGVKSTVETLTRRGRKFGLGVNIATQRSTYLDTNIMGQLHTYFISRLPRDADRQRVGEAFALSKEEFTQTFQFQPGEWLLISHEATGLTGVSIPIKSPNAEIRISEYIEKFDPVPANQG